MKSLSTRVALVLALFVAAAPALAQQSPQIINIPLSRPGEPISLDIDIQSAHIEVIGEDRDDVEFHITIQGSERKIVTPSGTQSVIAGGYALEVDEHDNEISLDTDWRDNKVTVVARVPTRADLSLGTLNDGVIIVTNITGNLELENMNGPITATGISGSVIAGRAAIPPGCASRTPRRTSSRSWARRPCEAAFSGLTTGRAPCLSHY